MALYQKYRGPCPSSLTQRCLLKRHRLQQRRHRRQRRLRQERVLPEQTSVRLMSQSLYSIYQ